MPTQTQAKHKQELPDRMLAEMHRTLSRQGPRLHRAAFRSMLAGTVLAVAMLAHAWMGIWGGLVVTAAVLAGFWTRTDSGVRTVLRGKVAIWRALRKPPATHTDEEIDW